METVSKCRVVKHWVSRVLWALVGFLAVVGFCVIANGVWLHINEPPALVVAAMSAQAAIFLAPTALLYFIARAFDEATK